MEATPSRVWRGDDGKMVEGGGDAPTPPIARAALYERNPIQRFFRDIHAINAHISFNFDIAGAQYGRAVLGLEEGGGLL